MMYPMYYWFDPTYILVIAGVIICLAASAKMRSTFNRYSRVRSHSGLTGREAAQEVLRRAGIYDVRVERVSGNLTDHYDPCTKCCGSRMLRTILHHWQRWVWRLTSAGMPCSTHRGMHR